MGLAFDAGRKLATGREKCYVDLCIRSVVRRRGFWTASVLEYFLNFKLMDLGYRFPLVLLHFRQKVDSIIAG